MIRCAQNWLEYCIIYFLIIFQKVYGILEISEMCAKYSSQQIARGGKMFSSSKFTSFFPLLLTLPIFFLNSCGIEKSEYGKKSDYQKLGYTCPVGTDVDPPTISSEIPEDNSSYNSVATTTAVTFDEAIATSSITVNTSDTTCSGSFQLSSDNFSTCIKMSAAPVASNDNKTFTVTPASSLSADTTFKRRLTGPIADTSCNVLAIDNTSIVGFSTSPSGSGTIEGTVQMDNGSALSGVNVNFKLLANASDDGSTAGDATSVDNGTFSKDSLGLGIYSLTYSKDDFIDTTLTDTLETDGETLTVETVRLLSDNCTAGTMSGTITDAVSGSGIKNVWLWYRPGMNRSGHWLPYYKCSIDTSCNGGLIGYTDENGAWSVSSVPAGWYTVRAQAVPGGRYYNDTFNVYACGNQANQDATLSTPLDPGMMRISLYWPSTTPTTGVDLDSHLYIPYSGCTGGSDKDDKCHLWFNAVQSSAINFVGASTRKYHIYDGVNNSSSSDYVSLDRDETVAPGSETITIKKVRSGTYSYSIHNLEDKDATNNDSGRKNLKRSRARVRVLYNDGTKVHSRRFWVRYQDGTLWTVFTFNKDSSAGRGSGLTRARSMSYQDTPADIY